MRLDLNLSLNEVYTPTTGDILGKTYANWIVKWWNQEQDPREDGAFLLFADYDCSMSDTIEIPSKKQGLLISPINFIAIDESGDRSEKEMIDVVKYEIDIINKNLIRMTFDSMEFGPFCSRVGTGFFTLNDGRKAITDGYWAFIRGPFDPGKHTLNSFGTCRSGKIQLSNTTFLKII